MRKTLKLVLSMLLAGIAVPAAADAEKRQKTVYGLHEHIYIAELGVTLRAKLDTGATTSSLSAHNIKRFKRDGESWVRFQLAYKDAPVQVFELPITRVSRIKRRADDFDPEEEKTYSARPVVSMTVQMGDRQEHIEVNLTDRSAFQYPFLLGARGLKSFDAMVDPSVRFSAGQPQTSPTQSSRSE